MTGVLVWKLLRDLRLPLLAVALLLMGFEGFWAKISQRILEALNELLQNRVDLFLIMKLITDGPSGQVTQAMMGGDTVRITRMLDLLSIGFVHPLFQTILCVWAIGRAAGAVAGEIDRGTMELLLAQPIPRWRVILAHFIVDLITIPILCGGLWGGNWLGVLFCGTYSPGAGSIEREVLADPLRLASALPSVAGLLFAVGGLTMWASARGRFRNRVLGLAVFTALTMFLVNIVGQLWELFAPLRQLTIFYYYQPQRVLLQNEPMVKVGQFWSFGGSGLHATESLTTVPGVAVLVVVGAVGYLMALASFCRRDLPAPL